MTTPKSLAQCVCGKQNNLDLFRFIAALLVIFSHAYPICLGSTGLDPLERFTSEQLSFGGLAVSVFFVYGGFLIAHSADRSKTARHYFVSRCLRIFPALWFAVFTLAFIIGPLFSSLSTSAYFQSSDTYLYLLNGVLILRHPLPGVFTHNVYNAPVNGALSKKAIHLVVTHHDCFLFWHAATHWRGFHPQCSATPRRSLLHWYWFLCVSRAYFIAHSCRSPLPVYYYHQYSSRYFGICLLAVFPLYHVHIRFWL